MQDLIKKYVLYLRGVAANRLGQLGVILTTSSFITFVILEIGRMMGFITNAYVGLVTYMVIPLIFIIGLLLIPLGWRRLKKKTGKSGKELMAERFDSDNVQERFAGSKIFVIISVLTLANILFLSILSGRMLHFMDGAEFCGTACHEVMNPEWVTYQQSPHARVHCVQCHVGEGVGALIDSKLNGLWQIVSATFKLYQRPIPTPVHQLRPARETCEKCHWPAKFYGPRIKAIADYKKDSASTPNFTTLSLKIDSRSSRERIGIHWHISEENEIHFASDEKREEIKWVDVRQPDGSFHRYVNEDLKLTEEDLQEEYKVMDCVDCHNRATHIYEDPNQAVNDRIAENLISRQLPFIKREALSAITANYNTLEAAMDGISNSLHGFYQRNYPELQIHNSSLIDSAVMTLQAVYNRNIHPEMNITWGSYPSHLGHQNDLGCWRCHNGSLVDEEGEYISYDCTICHSILAEGSDDPFKFLFPPDSLDPESDRHEYLRQEFMKSLAQ